MENDLPELLTSHFEDPFHRGECTRPTHAGHAQDAMSGHYIAVQVNVDDTGIVEEAWFSSNGCIYCEAPASILLQYCEGKSLDDLCRADENDFLRLTELDRLAIPQSCQKLAWTALANAIKSDAALDEGQPMFGGPSLSEES